MFVRIVEGRYGFEVQRREHFHSVALRNKFIMFYHAAFALCGIACKEDNNCVKVRACQPAYNLLRFTWWIGRRQHECHLSIASFGLRLGAFAVDSVLCALIAWGLTRDTAWTTPIFALEVLLLTATAGSSAGQRLVGLQVVRLDRRPVGLWRAVVRTALLLLLVPALIWDRDGRGLHDKAAGTVLVSKR